MSAPDTPAPYAPQPLDAAEGHGNPPSQAAPESTTRRGLLDKLTARLTGLYDAREARSIALIALAELAGLPLSALLTDPGAPMAADGFEAMAAQLAAGRPVQYAVGHTEFYGHRFAVREGVLIPRPETEELVSWVVHDERRARALLDVGTGSGILAMAAALLGAKTIHAVDIDEKAVEVAQENIAQNGLSSRITVNQGNLLDGTPGQADLIIANIIADIIILVLPEVAVKLRQNGRFLASGIIEERLPDVEKAARENGFTFLDVKRKAGWCAVTMGKED